MESLEGCGFWVEVFELFLEPRCRPPAPAESSARLR